MGIAGNHLSRIPVDPRQVGRQAALDWQLYDFGNVVAVIGGDGRFYIRVEMG